MQKYENIPVRDMKLDDAVEGFYLMKNPSPKTTQSGKDYLVFNLADATGEIEAKLWDYAGDLHTKCNGKPVKREKEFILIALNKPVGIECTSDRNNPDNIIDFVNYPKRIYTIGRLDKNSEGLILMTNDGDIVNKISKSSNVHEKEYVVRVNKPITGEFVKNMQDGVKILDRVTRPCKVYQENKDTFRIILTQGLNRQIRRMCEALGYRVLELKRIRVMNIRLGRLKTGTYRNVTKKEREELLEMIKDSKN